jgi:GT2 family glycosyltransferase
LSATRSLWVLDNGDSSESVAPQDACVVRLPSGGKLAFGAGHNRLMRAAFADGAFIYVAINPNGIMHPNAVGALVRMVQAHDGRALVEALPLPVDDPKPYDPVTLDTPWVSGACLALSRIAFEELVNLDEAFSLYGDEMGLPQRARASGLVLKTCPTALFLRAVGNHE